VEEVAVGREEQVVEVAVTNAEQVRDDAVAGWAGSASAPSPCR